MTEKYEFKYIQNPSVLKYKTIVPFEEKIFLIGGISTINQNNAYVREDFILEKTKDKYKIKIKKMESKDCSL